MLPDLLEILLRAVVLVAAVIALIRLNGLRSLSKMSSFDFVITIAFGSVIASAVISPDESVLYGVVALAGLFVVQNLIARARIASDAAQTAVDNAPLMIMRDGEILHDNLRKSRMTEADLYGKLREANAYNLAKVRAVVFEPAGDVSVLHGDTDDDISAEILAGVTT